jgi:integrase
VAEASFRESADSWLESRRPYLAPSTFGDYRQYIGTLAAFFKRAPLSEITAEQIRAYQRERLRTVGASAINKECCCLQQMLRRIGRWAELAGDYQRIPLPKEERGRAMSDAEYRNLFRMATYSPNWEAAYLFAVISVNTTAGPKEVRTLRLQDVDLENQTMRVNEQGAKNPGRVRVIPLNDRALEAVVKALERARSLGSSDPHHYLFPFRIHRGLYDPARCQRSFKTAWREMTAAAGLEKGFRMYDLRHHAITSLLEDPTVSEETAESVAGHITHKMKRKYSHVRMAYRRAAVQGLSGHGEAPKKLPNTAKIAERLGVDSETVLRILLEYEKSKAS